MRHASNSEIRNGSASFGVLLQAALFLTLLMVPLTARATSEPPLHMCGPVPIQSTEISETDFNVQTPSGQIGGTLAVPSEGQPQVLVLMLHGYTGARNENGRMFRRAAKAFAQHGIGTLRIDFIGSGRSDGEWADTRFSTQARDAARAVKALRGAFENARPVGVLGYSQGGLVAIKASANGAGFDFLTLWNPVMDPMATYGIIFGRAKIEEGAQLHAEANVEIVPDTRLRPGFFAEIVDTQPIAEAAQSQSNTLIVTGQRDPLVKNGASLAAQIAEARTGQTTLLDFNGGHDLGALRAPDLFDRVVSCTAAYILDQKAPP